MKNNSKLCSILATICVICAMVCVAVLTANLDGQDEFKSLVYVIGFLFGGCLGSFIISGLFYWLGIRPLIKPQFKEAVIFEIVTKFIGLTGADKDALNEEREKDFIEAKLLKKLFPETFKFITDYERTFNDLYADHNINGNYAEFATAGKLRFYKEATKKDKSEVAEARKKFIKKLNNVFYEDLKD